MSTRLFWRIDVCDIITPPPQYPTTGRFSTKAQEATLTGATSPPPQPSTTTTNRRGESSTRAMPMGGQQGSRRDTSRAPGVFSFQNFICINKYIYCTVATCHINTSRRGTHHHSTLPTIPLVMTTRRAEGPRGHIKTPPSQPPTHHTQPRHTTAMTNGARDDHLDMFHHPLHSGWV